MNGAKRLFQRLVYHKVQHVFGYPGGAILPVLNEFYNQSSIQYILSRTEAGGSFMAEGYAKATQKPGVVMVTSGPGAINIMTSLQNALSDGTPLLALTGQVATTVIGTDAFQEADIVGISSPCTKWNHLLTDGTKIDYIVDKAFTSMMDTRHGPVLLDLPKNIMAGESGTQYTAHEPPCANIRVPGSNISIEDIHSLLLTARRPMILAGQGVFQSDSVLQMREFLELYKVPITTTLMGLGIVDERNRRSLKMLGMHGSFAANMAIQHCDLLLNFGSRFDDRIIGNPKQFAPKATIVHIDILPKNINKTIRTKYYRAENCHSTLEQLLNYNVLVDPYHTYQWWKQIHEWKRTMFTYTQKKVLQGRHVLATLNRIIQADRNNSYTIVSDVGAHQMWAAQFLDYDYPRVKFLTSGGLGTMGFALPASIGVKIGVPQDRVICVCGDGGFLMTAQELVTAIEHGVGIKVLILNNQYQLMVKIWQEKFYANRIVGTKMNNPPFEQICRAYGCEALRVDSHEGLESALQTFLAYDKGPIVLHAVTDSDESVLPMVAPGCSLDTMILEDNESEKGEGKEDKEHQDPRWKGDAPC